MARRVPKWRATWEWFRVPYLYWIDRVDVLSPRALSVDLGAWMRAWRDLTDGFLSERDAFEVCQRAGCCRRDQRLRVISELLEHGFWLKVEGGYELVDWLVWNPSREEMDAKRDADRRRQATQRRRHAERTAAERAARW